MNQHECVTIDGCSMHYRHDTHDRTILSEVWEAGCYSEKFPYGKKAVIVDIGAHNGYFSLYASLKTAPESKIYAFEPVKDNFRILMENLELNGVNNVQANNICVAASSGTLTMYVNTSHTGGHSQYRERIEKYKPDTIEAIECTSITFDQTVPSDTNEIDFCKIDCEGAEFDILLNAPEDFLRKVKVFAMEFHEFGGHKVDELVNLFQRLGLAVTYNYSPSKLGISFGNLLAVRD